MVELKVKYLFHIFSQWNALSTTQTTDFKTHCILVANSYVFRHQVAIFREFIDKNVVGLTHIGILRVRRTIFCELVPKHVGIGT
jgi:hypothetical protein